MKNSKLIYFVIAMLLIYLILIHLYDFNNYYFNIIIFAFGFLLLLSLGIILPLKERIKTKNNIYILKAIMNLIIILSATIYLFFSKSSILFFIFIIANIGAIIVDISIKEKI